MPVWRYAGNGRLRRAEAPIQKPHCKLEATLFLKPPTTMPTELPPRFTELKRAIAATNPNFEQDLTKAWKEVLAELDKVTKTIAKEGPAVSDIRFVLCKRPNRPVIHSSSVLCGSRSVERGPDRGYQAQGNGRHQGRCGR